jgi:acyl-coenzyme A synthetase/AMP-(fatty) acid ligase
VLLEKIQARARLDPGKTAFICNGVSRTYAEFGDDLAQASGFFARQQLPVASVAVLCIEDLAQVWVLGIALRHLGVTTVAVNTTEEIAGLELGNISCVVTWAPENSVGLAGCRWINVPRDLAVFEGEGFSCRDGRVAPGGHIIQTSGTTGAYKKVLRDAVVEASTLDLHADINGITADSLVYVRDFPLWTAGGYRWPLLSWHQGATVVFQQWQDFHLPMFTLPLTHAFATPMTLMFVSQSPDLPVRRNDAMHLLVTGGAMPRALVAALKQRLTNQVYAVLASTEALTLSATLIEELDDIGWYRIHPSREVQVVDEFDQPLGAGKVGLIRARILDGVGGYLDDEAASRTFFRDGFFYSGDLAMLHEDGRLALCGRVTDIVNVLGNKIATAPIETALQNRLAVDAVCLLSMPLPGADDELQVAIESSREPSPAELKAAALDLLNGLGRIRFHVFKQLPRNRMGKVMRLELQQLLLARLGRS